MGTRQITTQPDPNPLSKFRRYFRQVAVFGVGVTGAVLIGWILTIPIVNVFVGGFLVVGMAFVVHRVEARREEAVVALSEAYTELEPRIQARTAALEQTNRQLELEVAGRQKAEVYFHSLLEYAPNAVVIVDQHGSIVLVNHQTEKLLGYERAELIGKSLEVLVPEALRQQHVTHRAEYVGTPRVREMGTGMELAAVHKDGRAIPVEISLSAIESEEGLRVVAAIRDIRERKESERALRERDQSFQEITDHLDQAIWLRDAIADKMLFMSPAYEAITGQSPQTVLKNTDSLLDIVHPDDRAFFRQARVQQIEATSETEYRIIKPDGSVRWINARTFPIRNSEGSVYRIAGISEDVTLRREGEAHRLALQIEQERVNLLKRFLGDASHDFRTPLAIMSVSLYMLEKLEATERQRHHIGVLMEQYDRLRRLIEDLFTLSRLDKTSTAELEIQRCDLNVLVEAASARQKPLLASKHSRLTLNLTKGLSPIFADAAEISLAIQHVLVNAINYSPPEAEIKVSTQQQNDSTVVLSVEDRGIGISESDLPHIFERFYRADPARSINTGGLGLGLSIAKRIVDAHHGSIMIQSAPGKGSTFTLTFPAFR